MKINFLNQDIKWKESLRNGFDTQRLRVQALDGEDLKKIPEINGDNELFTFVNAINDGDEAEDWVKSVYQKRGYLFFSVRGKADRPVADDSLMGILMLNRDFDGQIEIGGWLGSESQGKGYSTEIIKGLVGLIRKKRKGWQLYAEVHQGNIAAIRALKGSGVKLIVNPCRKRNDRD